jgi:hypothetical protein
MKIKLRCGSCGTTKNSATGQTLYALGESEPMIMLMDRVTECWDCGDKRRSKEDEKKQKLLTRLMQDDA